MNESGSNTYTLVDEIADFLERCVFYRTTKEIVVRLFLCFVEKFEHAYLHYSNVVADPTPFQFREMGNK